MDSPFRDPVRVPALTLLAEWAMAPKDLTALRRTHTRARVIIPDSDSESEEEEEPEGKVVPKHGSRRRNLTVVKTHLLYKVITYK